MLTPDNWVDLFKWVVTLCIPLGFLYAGANKYFAVVRSRPPALEDKASKLIAASLERDSHARLEYMDQMSRVLEKLASIQLGMAENGVKAQSNTETLHKMTRERIDSMASVVGRDLGEIKENQRMINGTIERFGQSISGRLA